MEEIKQEKIEEYRQEAMLDARLATDYDFFLEYYYEDINDFIVKYNELKYLFESFGYEFDTGEFI